MFCIECVYWSGIEGKCILNSEKCLADKIPDEESEDEKRETS